MPVTYIPTDVPLTMRRLVPMQLAEIPRKAKLGKFCVMKSDTCDPYFRQIHVRNYKFRHRFVRKFSSVNLSLRHSLLRNRGH